MFVGMVIMATLAGPPLSVFYKLLCTEARFNCSYGALHRSV